MSWPTVIFLIVALAILADVIKSKNRARQGITTDMMGGEKIATREDPALQREVEELRERVKVLERIATEDRDTKLLSAEIERLREK